jgi:hypothetical protein
VPCSAVRGLLSVMDTTVTKAGQFGGLTRVKLTDDYDDDGGGVQMCE